MEHSIEKRDGFRVVGRRAMTAQGGGTWQLAHEDGSVKRMEDLQTGKPLLGLCFGFDAQGRNDYMVGVEYGFPVDGLETFEYPAARWLTYRLSARSRRMCWAMLGGTSKMSCS